MNVNVGTTQTGAVDNLPRIHELLVEKVKGRGVQFAIHVDAHCWALVFPSEILLKGRLLPGL